MSSKFLLSDILEFALVPTSFATVCDTPPCNAKNPVDRIVNSVPFGRTPLLVFKFIPPLFMSVAPL